MAPGGDVANTEGDLATLGMHNRAPRHWNRGTMIRFVLAITPTVTFAILGATQQHLHAH